METWDPFSTLREDQFENHAYSDSDFVQKSFGDRYDGLYGDYFYTVSRDDIDALLNGKVLYTTISEEYALLVKLKGDAVT